MLTLFTKWREVSKYCTHALLLNAGPAHKRHQADLQGEKPLRQMWTSAGGTCCEGDKLTLEGPCGLRSLKLHLQQKPY